MDNPVANPTPELLDFWKTLWHVDVHKDHGNTYDAKIINDFLPDPKYTTTQVIDNFKISTQGQFANRNGGTGKVLGFAELFKHLTGIEFTNIQNQPVGYKLESTLNPTLMGKPVKYQIEVFDDKGNGVPSKLDTFVGEANNIALFVDTSSHLPELLQNYTQKDKIVYAYTREIESDPADKTTYLSIKPPPTNQNNFFYELVAPKNPTVIAYPPYSPKDGMSYFYCKYPVFLRNDGIREPKKYNLKTTLSYIRSDNKTITVTDGANTAGAFDKFKNGLKKTAGLGSDKDMKEIVFISKHHGDVAQSLVKFRDVRMKCPNKEPEIHTADYEATFVSIDVNAIIKALTIETPFIFMYPPDKKRIIVWKNNSLNSPKVQFESEKKFTNDLQAKLLASVNKYNDNALHIQINQAMVAAKTGIDLALNPKEINIDQPLEYYASLYRDTLKLGVHISTLLKYIQDEPIQMVDIALFNEQDSIDAIKIDGLDDNGILKQITELKVIQKKLSEKEAELKIPIEYRTIILQGANLEAISFEKDVIVEFKKYQVEAAEAVKSQAKLRAGPTYSFKKGDRRIDNMWEVTNLSYNIGDFSIESLECRFGTKLNNSWAFDIIHYCYNNLKEYKDAFIKTLHNIVEKIPQPQVGKPAKIETFKFGLDLVGIPLPQSGGGKVYTAIQQPTKTNTIPSRMPYYVKNPKNKKIIPSVLTVKKFKAPLRKNFSITVKNSVNELPVEIIALKTEYNDMIIHLEFILDILYLYKYNNKIPSSAFELFGLQIYDRFFKKVFGENYEVSSQSLSGLTAIRRQEKSKMKGGAKYIAFQAGLIKEVFDTEGNNESTIVTELPESKVFNNTPFLTTQFSIIQTYEDINNKEDVESLTTRIDSLRNSVKREDILRELKEKKEYITSLIKQIKDKEIEKWEQEEVEETPVAIPLTGKKRKRENNNHFQIQIPLKPGQSPAKKSKQKGGTRKIQKRYKFKTFKKRSKTGNKRNKNH